MSTDVYICVCMYILFVNVLRKCGKNQTFDLG